MTLKKRLHEEPHRPNYTHKHKDPQEKTVDNHRHVFPVFNDLQRDKDVGY